MSKAHDRGVTRNRLHLENALDDGYWQDFFVEEPYYEGQDAPVGPKPDDKGRMKGEFDVLAVNYDDQLALYTEVKSSRGDLYKAEKQLERAEKHFAPHWEMIGQTWLED